VTTSATSARRSGTAAGDGDRAGGPHPARRSLASAGVIAASVAAGAGLAALVMLVLAGWIAAPHAGGGLVTVLRAAAVLWLIAHHVSFALHGVGVVGMLPLGLVLLPGALLWRAGRWIARSCGFADQPRLRHIGYLAVALAAPYALLAGAVAVASRSALAAPSPWEAVICTFLLALAAGGLGGAHAIAPWRRLAGLLPDRARAALLAVCGSLGILIAAGVVLAVASLTVHLSEFGALIRGLEPGAVGTALLFLIEIAYLPNAAIWGSAFLIGPGFAFGNGTVVAPTGAALGRLPDFPLLAALPPGVHSAAPLWLTAIALAVPYAAGCAGGLLLTRTAPAVSVEAAALWGLACGAATGAALGVLAAFAGGPLGSGRLSAVGPSGWQVGGVAALEIGVACAVTVGCATWLRLRRQGYGASAPDAEVVARPDLAGRPGLAAGPVRPGSDEPAAGHVIYLDQWSGNRGRAAHRRPGGPSALP
jgi:hypothetical protein